MRWRCNKISGSQGTGIPRPGPPVVGRSRRSSLGAAIRQLVGAAVCIVQTTLLSQPILIQVGDHEIPEGTPSFVVIVTVAGSAAVTDLLGVVQIGDGGPAVGGSTGPRIRGIRFDRSVWSAAPGGFEHFYPSSSPPAQIVDPNVSLNEASDAFIPIGTLFELEIDVRGVGPADFDLRLTDTAGGDTELFHRGTPIDALILNGHIRVIPASSNPDDKAAWRTAFFNDDAADPDLEETVWGDQADPDDDQLTNEMEYLHGMNPLIADRRPVSRESAGVPHL